MQQKDIGKKPTLFQRMWKYRAVYALLIPGIIWYVVFAYFPMVGLSLAFKTYKARLGILGSPWVGMANFANVFRDPAFLASVKTTLLINLGRIPFEFPIPLILAILLNEIRSRRYKKVLQTIFTFPQFLSWVIIAGILINLLSSTGLVNSLMNAMGLGRINFLGSSNVFIPMIYVTDNWKSAGWSAIIYLAAIAGIDTSQFEAAEIDGASRIKQIFYITLPNLMPTISVLFILSMGGLMSAGFDQLFNMSNDAVRNSTEILDMYIYRITFQSTPDFSFSMAVSLFRSVINLVLLVIADRGAKLLSGSGLFA